MTYKEAHNLTKKERLRAGLTAELYEDDQMRIHVVGKPSKNADPVSLGSIMKELIYADPHGARIAIERIKFGC